MNFAYTATGRRQTMSDPSGTTTYGYDGRDRLQSKQTPFGTLSYTYDSAGNLKTTASSNTNGANVTYGYDVVNRLATVTDNTAAAMGAVNATTTYGYDAAGNLAAVAYPNNVSTTYSYNLLNRLTQVAGTTATATLASYQYTLGAAGNRTGVKELTGRTVAYEYDDVYRLTKETISAGSAAAFQCGTSQCGAVSYTYDSVGNRQVMNSTLGAVPAGLWHYDANDRLDTDTYDNNGNTVSSAGIQNQYDFENHLVQHGDVAIVYDGDGNRVSETVGGVTTNYLVDTQNPTGYAQVLEEQVNGVVVRSYTYGLQLISQRLATNDQQQSFYGYDGHGSVRYLTDVSGAVTDTYDYDAFGNLISSTGSTPNNYLFAGEQWDAALGLYYNRARYLNTSTGRFWTADRLGGHTDDPISLHRYLYSFDNPANLVDPTGTTPLTDVISMLARFGVHITARLFGIQAHQLIEKDIQKDFGSAAHVEVPVPGGVIDVFIEPNQVFEIKPFGGTIDPERQISRYIDAAGDLLGAKLERGLIIFDKMIDGPLGVTQIYYFTSSPGVIEYTAFPSTKLVATAIAFVILYNLAQLKLDLGLETALQTMAPGIP